LSAANSFNALTYLWDFDNDGQHDDATGSTPNFVTAVDGVYPISLRIENGGQFDVANSTISVNNVAPTADIGGPYAGAPGTTISLDAAGSSDPGGDIASYAWDFDNDGFDDATGSTASFTPLASGSITIRVQVTDDDGASSIASATLYASNDVVFTAVNSLVVSGNDLSRETGTGWTASAISVGALEEDGYMEFTGTIGGKAMVGLSENATAAHFSSIPYAFYKNINRIEIYEFGVQRGSFGTFDNGDTLRISIDKGDVTYSHNGSELRRIIGSLPLEGFSFNADIAIEARGTTVQGVVLVIPPPENPEITDYEGFDVDNLDTVYGADDIVSITFHQKTDMAGYAQDQVLTKTQVDELFTFNPAPADAYTGYWSHPAIFIVNIVTPAATAPQFGSATVQTAGTRPIYNAKTPLLATTDPGTLAGHWGSVVVLWTNPIGVLVDGNKLTRPSSGPERWDAGAASSRTFTGDGYMESIVNVSGKNRMIGFSAADSDQHFASLDFAIFLHSSGNAEAYELGVQRGNLGRYRPGDTIRIERTGSEMRYMLNGLTRRTKAVSPTLGFKVDCSLNARGSVFNKTILVLPDSVITASRATDNEPIRDAISLYIPSGWSLVGIPLDLDDPTPAFLNGTSAEAGRAYWIHNPRAPYSIVLTGTQAASQPAITGDLYAPIRTSPVPVGSTAWTYTDSSWRLADGPLEAGQGYLLR
jgi:PKD repeat protein